MGKKLNFFKTGGVILSLLMFALNVSAQNITVRGSVTSTTGEPIIGASVQITGTAQGVITNFDGAFELPNVPSDGTLQVSFMGMNTESQPINGRTVINFILADTFSDLDELIVIGYGVRRRALVTGATVDVTGDQIANMRTTTAMEALQGVVPGVQITRNHGAPGAGTTVTIRGQGTIGNAAPLFVVDGVAVSNIDFLNPSDIERLDVLKDAASAAIFGARAANGVILVTTRRGRAGMPPRVTYDGSFGFQNMWRRPTPLNAQQYMFLFDEARINDGNDPFDWHNMIVNINNPWLESTFPGAGREFGQYVWDKLQSGWTGTDWVGEMTMRNAPMQSHSINITGGAENIVYTFGFSYFDQTGIIGGHITDAGFRRLTARMNTETVLFRNERHSVVTFGQNFTFSNTQNRSVATGDIYWNDLHSAIVANPLIPLRWDNPRVNQITRGWGPSLTGVHHVLHNPIAIMEDRHRYNWSRGNTVVGNVYGIVEPIQNLRFRSAFGINAWFGHSRSFNPVFRLAGGPPFRDTDNVTQSMHQGVNYTWTNTLTYDWTMGDNHNFSALVGTEMLKFILNTNVTATRANTLFGSPDHAFLWNTAPPTGIGDISANGRDLAAQGGGLMSYMTRLSYNFASRYMIDVVLRADGSSNFAPENRWGYFPSVSAGWNFTEEEFMHNIDWLNFGRLRASWGQNGNQSIPSFVFLSNIAFLPGGGYQFSPDRGTIGPGAFPVNIPNPDIRWETSEQLNFGLDTRMFRSRLAFSFDVYRKMTRDWLVQAPVLGTSGANAPMINGGDVENRGFELMLSWNDRIGDFRYGVTVSGTRNRNRVTRLANAEGIIRGSTNVLAQNTSHVSQVSVGRPIGYFYGFRTDGIFQNQAEVDAWEAMMLQRRIAAGTATAANPGSSIGIEQGVSRRPGDVRFVDQTGSGMIDDSDRVMLGSPHPDFELGLQLNAEWRGFFANTTLVGKFGMQVMQSFRDFGGSPMQNFPTSALDRWHGEGTSNRLPRLSTTTNANATLVSDLYLHNADFLRISNLTLGYRFDDMLRNVSWLQAGSVFMTINNLHTFTSYDGMDPEVGWAPNSWASGIDLGLYPLARTVIFGVNLTF